MHIYILKTNTVDRGKHRGFLKHMCVCVCIWGGQGGGDIFGPVDKVISLI